MNGRKNYFGLGKAIGIILTESDLIFIKLLNNASVYSPVAVIKAILRIEIAKIMPSTSADMTKTTDTDTTSTTTNLSKAKTSIKHLFNPKSATRIYKIGQRFVLKFIVGDELLIAYLNNTSYISKEIKSLVANHLVNSTKTELNELIQSCNIAYKNELKARKRHLKSTIKKNIIKQNNRRKII